MVTTFQAVLTCSTPHFSSTDDHESADISDEYQQGSIERNTACTGFGWALRPGTEHVVDQARRRGSTQT